MQDEPTLPAPLSTLLDDVRARRRFDVAHVLRAKLALLRNFLSSSGLQAAVVGVSGGIDSALVAALLARLWRERGSPLQRVVAALLPMHDTAGATNQHAATAAGRRVIDALGLDHALVDLSASARAFERSLNDADVAPGSAWSTGQLVSVLRTPALYGLVARLNDSGMPAVVVGTTNRDEGSFIGFFGKASDGMVDVQPIADLHKSEVRALAGALGVPDEIVWRTPTGDTFDGRSDVDMIGAPYDAVELYSALRADGIDAHAPAIAMPDDVRAQWLRWCGHIEAHHRRNAHKYRVGSPAVFLDVLRREVPALHEPRTPRDAGPRWSEPPASAFVARTSIADDVVALTARSVTEGRAQRVAGARDAACVVHDVLAPVACDALARAFADAPARPVDHHGRVRGAIDGALHDDEVGSWRVTAWTPALADTLWRALAPHLPPCRTVDGDDDGAFLDAPDGSVWRPVGLNPLMRGMIYRRGGHIVAHRDAPFVHDDGVHRTLMSVVWILRGSNDETSGGITRLLVDHQRHLPLHERNLNDDDGPGDDADVLFAHAPRQGSVLVFDHRVRHDVTAWRGDDARVVLRTDVVFARCGPHAPHVPLPVGDDTDAAPPTSLLASGRRDALLGPLLRGLTRDDEERTLHEAAFFDDGTRPGATDASDDVHFLDTPLGRLAEPVDDDRPLVVLAATGAFAPPHQGHVALLETARAHLQRCNTQVLGGWLVPDHDAYVLPKCAHEVAAAAHRVRWCEDAVAGHDGFMVDPHAALFVPGARNYTTLVDRLQRYVSRHVRTLRPIHVVAVFGGDNARFTLAFRARGRCVCVARPGHDEEFDRLARDPRVQGCRRISFVRDATTPAVSSRALRATKRAPDAMPAAQPARSRLLLRDDLRWTLSPWSHPEHVDEAALSIALPRFRARVCAALQDAFASAHAPERARRVDVEFASLDAQAELLRGILHDDASISLDPCLPGTHALAVSRAFPLVTQHDAPRIVARPGHPTLPAQLAAIPPGRYVLVDDDTASGATLRAVTTWIGTHAPHIDISRTVTLVERSGDLIDVGDLRDFVPGARDAGLVVTLPDGTLGRAPYVLPWVRPSERLGVPLSTERRFSRAIFDAQLELLATWHRPIAVARCTDAFARLARRAGFRPDARLVDVVHWHRDRLADVDDAPA